MYIHSPARFELRSQLHLLLNKWLLGFRPTKLSRLYIQGTTIVGIRLVFNYLRFFISQALPINASQENKKKLNIPTITVGLCTYLANTLKLSKGKEC